MVGCFAKKVLFSENRCRIIRYHGKWKKTVYSVSVHKSLEEIDRAWRMSPNTLSWSKVHIFCVLLSQISSSSQIYFVPYILTGEKSQTAKEKRKIALAPFCGSLVYIINISPTFSYINTRQTFEQSTYSNFKIVEKKYFV